MTAATTTLLQYAEVDSERVEIARMCFGISLVR